jgi:hypothetical protein
LVDAYFIGKYYYEKIKGEWWALIK